MRGFLSAFLAEVAQLLVTLFFLWLLYDRFVYPMLASLRALEYMLGGSAW
jgi:hypothetical protein